MTTRRTFLKRILAAACIGAGMAMGMFKRDKAPKSTWNIQALEEFIQRGVPPEVKLAFFPPNGVIHFYD